MAILPLVIAPDERLKIKSLPVNKVDDNVRKLIDDMLDTMYNARGIGLAAVQVGVHKRILVMDIGYGSDRYQREKNNDPNSKENQIYKMINPEIIYEDNEFSSYNEGCLSFPSQYSVVNRPKNVKVKYLDYHGNEKILEADGLLATCVQHEIDHLNGVVFVDHISALKRNMIMKKLKKLSKHNL